MVSGFVTTDVSIYLLAVIVIGGSGRLFGPVVGGVVAIGLSQFLGGLAQYDGIVFGLILIVFTVMWPEGALGRRRSRSG